MIKFFKKINKQYFPLSTLYIVSIPIGNIYDITLRALYILKISNIIICENIKNIKYLLNYYNIYKKKFLILYKFNEIKIINIILKLIKKKNRIILVTDCGTPTISDPGFYIINKIYKEKVNIIPIPGVSALITAFSISGIIERKFFFIGFLPKKIKQIYNILKNFLYKKYTLIFYESSHRLKNTLKILSNFYYNKINIIIAKELTKFYEKILKFKLNKIFKIIKKNSFFLKGQFVILLTNNKKYKKYNFIKILNILLKEINIKKTIKLTSIICNCKKKIIYNYFLKYKNIYLI